MWPRSSARPWALRPEKRESAPSRPGRSGLSGEILTVTKSPPISLRSLTTILAMALSACAASSKSSSPAASGEQGVVLLRTYYVALRPDVELS